jgi:hypothetical protein
MVTGVLEDTTLAKRDINLTYVDFSSAFNTVPHSALLEVMRRKGFPEDAIAAVGAIYSESVTSVLTPYGRTRPSPILRGTIQGDCLSPLLWNIFMDPLLRWLDTGDRGYEMATSSVSVSAAAYADDLVLPTCSWRDSRVQVAKVKRFSDWAGLSVNLTKCAHTALVAGAQGHAAQAPLPVDVDIATTTRANLTIPWLPPDETYRYLGVELNAALDWKADATDSATKAEAKALCIEESAASLRQKMMLLGGHVVMSTAYRFAAGGATPSAAARLDRDVARYAKRMWGASRNMAGTFIFLLRDLHGWGVPSLRLELVKSYGRVLLESLRDDDKLGRVTRGLVNEHLRRAREVGPAGGARLQEAYRSTLPTANLMRAMGNISVYLVGVELPSGAGGILRVVAEEDKLRTEDHGLCGRPGAGRYWAVHPLWDSGCYSLADVAVNIGFRAGQVKAVANSKECDRLTVSRELPVSTAPGLGAALANLADWASESPSRAYHLKAYHLAACRSPDDSSEPPCRKRPTERAPSTGYPTGAESALTCQRRSRTARTPTTVRRSPMPPRIAFISSLASS